MGGCSSTAGPAPVADIEDLSLPGRASKPASCHTALPEDEEWLRQLQGDREAAPLYSSKDLKVVHLELTTRCNAACPQCLRTDHGGRENPMLSAHHGELSLADVRRILPPALLRGLKKVYLCGNYGDPAVASQCLEVLRYLRSVPTLQVGLFTNGGMRGPGWWTELGQLMQGRGFVRFAIDGDESTNHLYRQQVDWNRLAANVSAFVAAGGKAEWDFIVFEHNEHQVEAMRAMAERWGFTKFTAKKTSRFLDKKSGVVRDFTPVKDVSGEVVRQLRPPKAEEWQNPAAVKDVQDVLATYGSMDAYYDACCISCKAANEREAYVSAEGLAFPCCWLAGDLYNMHLPERDRQLEHLLQALDPSRGVRGAQSALTDRRGLAGVVDRRGGLFQQLIGASMRRPSVAQGRLKRCAAVCGTQVTAFTAQFGGASAMTLDASCRSPDALVASPAAPQAPASAAGSVAPVLVWYGSETGNAQRLGCSLRAPLLAHVEVSSPPASPAELRDALAGRSALVLILATWGDGEPTADAEALVAWLEANPDGQDAAGDWPPVAVYGLGSSLWPRYNAVSRRVVAALEACGAPLLCSPGEADAAKESLDDQFARWRRDALLPALASLRISASDADVMPPEVPQALTLHGEVVELTVRHNRRLAPADPEVRYCELEFDGSFAYGAGDAVAILLPPSVGTHRPRWFTASSAGELGAPLCLTVRRVDEGACSPWLAELQAGAKVQALAPPRPSRLLATWRRSPSPETSPLVLVAAGAGIAPFVGLLDLLADARRRAPVTFYMGCRLRDRGLPQHEKLEAHRASGLLSRLVVAESRPVGGGRRLVQDALSEETAELGEALYPSDGGPAAVVLVCGAAAMGAAVRGIFDAVASGLQRGGVEDLERVGRYAAELW